MVSLLTEEALGLFIEEANNYLFLQSERQRPEYNEHTRNLEKAQKKIANIVNAINMGIVTPTTKAELERAEAECESAKAALEMSAEVEEVIEKTLPDAAQRYRNIVNDLSRALQTDIAQARQCLKTLLGQVRLVPSPSGGFLEAELRHSPDGLMALALKGNSEFKARLVAGAVSLPAISTS